jgi:hypothetical protein
MWLSSVFLILPDISFDLALFPVRSLRLPENRWEVTAGPSDVATAKDERDQE